MEPAESSDQPLTDSRLKPVLMLVLATACWAISFPVMKALSAHQQVLIAETNSWFFSALGVAYRFGLAALCMVVICGRSLSGLTRSEVSQGVGLGLFGGLGMVFQMDGLAHTSASTSAFLTQSYVLFLPLWQSLVERRKLSLSVVGACGAVVVGVGILSGVRPGRLGLGRGEVETLIASLLFTGQILWLQRPRYAGNDTGRFSLVMFAVMAACAAPFTLVFAPSVSAFAKAYSTFPSLTFLLLLVVACTLGGYLLMNHWQRCLGATEAGLIYCSEPVFASILALFLPIWLAGFAGIDYANERLTPRLIGGGGLILIANLIVQWHESRTARER